MLNLPHYQSAIFDAHFTGNNIDAVKLIVPNGLSGAQRLNIYRNNTFITLTEALSATFPVINKLVGDDFFKYMAGVFINEFPPTQGPLFEYGEDLHEFLNQFQPASSLPYIADVASLEWAINCSYHASDSVPLQPQELALIADNEIGQLRLDIHPTCWIVTSEFPIDQIWYGNQLGGSLDNIDLKHKATILVNRPEQTVKINIINPAYACFLKSLNLGKSIEEAFTDASALNHNFDPVQAITELLTMSAFASIEIENP
jgi:hypothetical protein